MSFIEFQVVSAYIPALFQIIHEEIAVYVLIEMF